MSNTIRWSPVTSHLKNGSPGAIVIGSPGAGKTFFLQNVAVNEIGMGRRVVVLDPKNDFPRIKNICSNVEIVDIQDIRPGALNPFTFLNSKDNPINTNTILTIIELLCGKLDKTYLTNISPIIKDFLTDYRRTGRYVDMQEIADYLYSKDNEYAMNIGSLLKNNEDTQFSELLFTRKENVEPLQINSTSNLVISLHGMSLPDYTTKLEDYTPNERFTSAIVFIIAKKLLDEVLVCDNKIPTTFICDEAHLLFANKEMHQLINKFLTLGRSLNTATVLASQGVNHFPEGISQYITSKFIFKSSIDDAKQFLEKYDTSRISGHNEIDIDSVIGSIIDFNTSGQCFFIDRLGRSGFVQITSNYDISKFTSNPLEKQREKEDAQ